MCTVNIIDSGKTIHKESFKRSSDAHAYAAWSIQRVMNLGYEPLPGSMECYSGLNIFASCLIKPGDTELKHPVNVEVLEVL